MPTARFAHASAIFLASALASAFMLSPSPASATYLRLAPGASATTDEAKKVVRFDLSVKNEGDEVSQEVEVDFPQLNEKYPVSKQLAPKQNGSFTISIPFDRIGIKERGAYALIYRVLYKDANLYPFSAPYLAQIELPPSPSRSLTVRFSTSDDQRTVELANHLALSAIIQNVSSLEAQVQRIEPIGPAEISVNLESPTSFSLKPQEEKEVRLKLTRAGALVGSGYGFGLLVSGVASERHFAERTSLLVKIVDQRPISGRDALGLALIGIAAAALIAWGVQRLRLRGRRR